MNPKIVKINTEIDKTKAKIAEECGLSEGAIRKRVKKLARTLRENPALKNYFE